MVLTAFGSCVNWKGWGKKSNLNDVYFDAGVARLRAVVERSIGRVKSWRIFSTSKSYCSVGERVAQLVVLLCGMVNWEMQKGGNKPNINLMSKLQLKGEAERVCPVLVRQEG